MIFEDSKICDISKLTLGPYFEIFWLFTSLFKNQVLQQLVPFDMLSHIIWFCDSWDSLWFHKGTFLLWNDAVYRLRLHLRWYTQKLFSIWIREKHLHFIILKYKLLNAVLWQGLLQEPLHQPYTVCTQMNSPCFIMIQIMAMWILKQIWHLNKIGTKTLKCYVILDMGMN